MARHAAKLLLTLLLGGLLCATLVRFAPGFAVSEEMMDTRLSGESVERLRAAKSELADLPRFYARFLLGFLRGELGMSESFGKPVGTLLKDRAGATGYAAGLGLLAGWLFALAVAVPASQVRSPMVLHAARSSGALLQCVPAGLLALLLLAAGSRGKTACGLAIGVLVFPRIIQMVLNLLEHAYRRPHVLAARARGLSEMRIFLAHVAPVCAPQLLALAGVSVSIAFSAAIPMEMILDVPGIGQLAWQAALSRDLVLLVNVTVLLAVVVTAANALSSWAGEMMAS